MPHSNASPSKAQDRPDLDTSSAIHSLKRLRASPKGVHTSLGVKFNNTLFARDSAITARELIDQDRELAREVILTLASQQGTAVNQASDEEPGRIHHEYRDFHEWEISKAKKLPMIAASIIWGGDTQSFTSYFSMDSTPLYVLLIADYFDRDPSILDERVVQKDGREILITESLTAAADWMLSHKTDHGLAEVRRRNKYGLTHQTWKDSLTGYIHENGDSLNLSQPIAYLEVQGLIIEGLRRAAKVLSKQLPERALSWREGADEIARTTLHDFWDEDDQYFVSSLDRDRYGNLRKDGVEQSDPGWLLATSIFDDIPENDRRKYIMGIVAKLFSEDFLTDAGIRSRSVEYATTLGVADYHGALVSWPIDTYMIAKGLRRQGFPKLAEQLEARVLNSVNIAGDFYEFFYVEANGKVLLNPEAARKHHPGAKDFPAQMFPEKGIAWTVAATLMIKYRNSSHPTKTNLKSSRAWQAELEDDILAHIPDISPIEAASMLEEKFKAGPTIHLDFKKGSAFTAKSVWEAYRPRLSRKKQKLSTYALKSHQVK